MKTSCCAMHPNERWKIYENDSASFPLSEKFVAIFLYVFPCWIRAPLIRIFIQSIHAPHAPYNHRRAACALSRPLCIHFESTPSFAFWWWKAHEWKSWNGTWLPCIVFCDNFIFGSKVAPKMCASSEYPVLCIRNFKLVRTFIMRRGKCLTRLMNIYAL